MGYTASSFAAILVDLFRWLLHPRAQSARRRELFPPSSSFHSAVPEPILDRVLLPIWGGVGQILLPLRAIQRGRIQQYLLYILLTLALLLIALVPIREIAARFVGW